MEYEKEQKQMMIAKSLTLLAIAYRDPTDEYEIAALVEFLFDLNPVDIEKAVEKLVREDEENKYRTMPNVAKIRNLTIEIQKEREWKEKRKRMLPEKPLYDYTIKVKKGSAKPLREICEKNELDWSEKKRKKIPAYMVIYIQQGKDEDEAYILAHGDVIINHRDMD